MVPKQYRLLAKATKIIIFLVLFFAALYYAKPVLVPLTFGILLAMLFVPLSRRLEKMGIGRGFSAVVCILLLLASVSGIILLLSTQMQDLPSDISAIEQKVKQGITRLQQHIDATFGISVTEQNKMVQQSNAGGKVGTLGTTIVSSVLGMLVDIILVLVYIFLFMYFRVHIKRFFLKLVPSNQNEKTQNVLSACRKVAEQYLVGLSTMIMMLWVMYGIGFSIVGIKNAIFFAVLCGLLEVVPFVGNLIGTAITLLMAASQGGGTSMIVGILVTYTTVQFVQTYILEPLVVGSEVNINPLATIIVLVVGETIWGIPGMILSIPILGIVKIVSDNVELLKPFGYLIGGQSKSEKPGLADKLKGWVSGLRK